MTRKGQLATLPGTLMMFIVVLMLTFTIFMVFYTNNNIITKNAQDTYRYQLGEQRKRSVMTVTLMDEVWRAPKTPRNIFENVTGYRLISYYFSTPPSEDLHIHGNTIKRENAKENLTHYLGYKMNQSWIDWQGEEVDYALQLKGESETLDVKVDSYYPSAKWSKFFMPIAINGGDKINMTLWTQTSREIYGVN